MGPSDLRIAVDGVPTDSVLVGAPGELVQSGIAVRVTDASGAPVAGASVAWETLGKGAQLLTPWAETDRGGQAKVEWVLGTDANEQQQLNVAVRLPGKEAQVVINARAVPHVVSALRVALDTPAVLRLGDTLPIRVNAVDPYGNAFPAPDVVISLRASGVGAVVDSSVIGTRRGRSNVHVASNGIAAEFPLHVTQFVAAIIPASDTISFTAVGAERPVVYTVRDDRGRIVADTVATIAVADTTKALVTGSQVRSLAPGATELHLALGSGAATIIVGVQQRVASLEILRAIAFDALLDTAGVQLIARDSMNSYIAHPSLSYQVGDPRVATFSSVQTLTAIAPGTTTVTVRDSATGISATADVIVRPRVASIHIANARIQFDAVGDVLALGEATPRDRLGSAVVGATLDYAVSDPTVAALEADGSVRSVGAGQATVTVRDSESGVAGEAVVVVDQVATRLTAGVDVASALVTLPVGATLPLTCQAFDRNGFLIVQHATLVASLNGTVTGGGCADAQVARSGYDTLVFTLGTVQTRVPVIVSTGDSVSLAGASHALKLSHGFTAISQPLDPRITFAGEDLANPLILALRPLVNDIFAAYGNPASNLDRARALRDWLARTAIHPYHPLHPNASTSNLGVLPPGKTWADANAAGMGKLNEDRNYWGSVGMDGYAMLNRLLGKLDTVTGRRADDGLMVQVQGARYRIRDVDTYRYVQCSYQAVMLNALWAAAGLHGMMISTIGHDPAAVFIPELGRWVYEDPTFNDEYLLDGMGEPLSPADMLALSSAGQGSRLRAIKSVGPSFDPSVYIAVETYINEGHPDGMVIMGSQLNTRVVGVSGTGGWPVRNVQVDVPRLAQESPFNDPVAFARVTAAVAFPTLGVVLEGMEMQDSVYVVRLSSTLPNHQRFERRLSGGAWESVGSADVLPVGLCRVEYRSVNTVGSTSARTALDVWVPRAPGFVEAGLPGSVREQARYCI